jgi:hypothetical protein
VARTNIPPDSKGAVFTADQSLSENNSLPGFEAEKLLFLPPGAQTCLGVGADLQVRIPFQPEAVLANSLYLPVDAHDPHFPETYHVVDTLCYSKALPQGREIPDRRSLGL